MMSLFASSQVAVKFDFVSMICVVYSIESFWSIRIISDCQSVLEIFFGEMPLGHCNLYMSLQFYVGIYTVKKLQQKL